MLLKMDGSRGTLSTAMFLGEFPMPLREFRSSCDNATGVGNNILRLDHIIVHRIPAAHFTVVLDSLPSSP